MGRLKARDALLRQFLADGIDCIFGNPGSTEENFLKAVGECRDMTYYLGLQEASVAAMADGWARVARKPAVCQIHSAVGLGNAMGVLYEASRAHTPILVLAGEPPEELQSFDGFLAGDLAKLAAPLCKWSTRLTHARQLGRIVRRAMKVAATPPCGPVFLALPMNVLDDDVDEADIFPTSQVIPSGACSKQAAREIAGMLVAAQAPVLVAGDGVSDAGGGQELHDLAHFLGLPIWGAEYNEPAVPFRDEMFMGLIGHSFGRNTRKLTLTSDVILAVGTPVFPELFPSTEPYFAADAFLIQIDRDTWEIAKNFSVKLGVQADPKSSLAMILEEAKALGCDESLLEARRRRVRQTKERLYAEEERSVEAVPDLPDHMSPATLMRVLVEEMPPEALVYDEALTSTPALLHYLRPDASGSYYLARGGCIGVGWPGAVGAAVAAKGRLVVAPSGDGSALFAVQTLWTAVNHRLNIVFIVCNNGAYRILKINLLNYCLDTGQQPGAFPFMDLENPRTDFTSLAAGFGMKAFRAANAEELRAALRQAFACEGPALVDAMINGSIDHELHRLFPADAG